MDSTEAFLRAQRGGGRWRLAVLSAAAVFVGGVSFLLGRYSAPQPAVNPVTAETSETVAVSSDLVAWLQAAQLFGQLGMNDRMARAVERAGRLVPVDAFAADTAALRAFAAIGSNESRQEREESMDMPGPDPSAQNVNQILAQALGD
jgi:hypothetical protein